MAFRLLLLCDVGSEIELNSLNFLRDIYDINWVEGDNIQMKNLSFMQENFKKSVSIKVAGFLVINMQIFLTIMNSAYSMLAVLQQIKK